MDTKLSLSSVFLRSHQHPNYVAKLRLITIWINGMKERRRVKNRIKYLCVFSTWQCDASTQRRTTVGCMHLVRIPSSSFIFILPIWSPDNIFLLLLIHRIAYNPYPISISCRLCKGQGRKREWECNNILLNESPFEFIASAQTSEDHIKFIRYI